jgi:hypothetical protein
MDTEPSLSHLFALYSVINLASALVELYRTFDPKWLVVCLKVTVWVSIKDTSKRFRVGLFGSYLQLEQIIFRV